MTPEPVSDLAIRFVLMQQAGDLVGGESAFPHRSSFDRGPTRHLDQFLGFTSTPALVREWLPA
jgi:hypothetical protein